MKSRSGKGTTAGASGPFGAVCIVVEANTYPDKANGHGMLNAEPHGAKWTMLPHMQTANTLQTVS